MRDTMPATSVSHCVRNVASSSTRAAIAAPWSGGIEYMRRARRAWCVASAALTVELRDSTANAPARSRYRPKFFEHEIASSISGTRRARMRTPDDVGAEVVAEALVCEIDERHQAAPFDDFGQRAPLLGRRSAPVGL